MNPMTRLTLILALAFSTSSFAQDCRAIFDPGYSREIQALVGKKFEIVDEEKVDDVRTVPFRIYVNEDLDVDPETLTLKVTFHGRTIIEEKKDSIGFYENVARTEAWLKNLPSCAEIYMPSANKY